MLETIFSSASELSVTPFASRPYSRTLTRVLLLIFGVICAYGSSRAATGQSGPQVIDVRPYAPVDGTSLESVSLANGSLRVGIPIWSYSQRGRLKLSFSLTYDGLTFNLSRFCAAVPTEVAPPTGGIPLYQPNVNPQAKPNPTDCSGTGCPGTNVAGESCELFWTPSAGDAAFPEDRDFGIAISTSTDFAMVPVEGINQSENIVTGYYWKLRTPDRGSHNMTLTSAGDYRSVDGTGWEYQPSNCTLRDHDGTKYVFSCAAAAPPSAFFVNFPGNLLYEEDTNGNQIQLNYTNNIFTGWTDTMGRNIPAPSAAPSTNTSACPASTSTSSTTATAWTIPGVGNPIVICSTPVSIQTHLFAPSQYSAPDAQYSYIDYSATPLGITGIVLPNADTWSFSYTPPPSDPLFGTGYNYGEVTQTGLPTGGSIQYRWSRLNSFCGVGPDNSVVRSVLQSRSILTGPSAIPSTWIYAIQVPEATLPTSGKLTSTVTDPLGDVSIHTLAGVFCSFYETSNAIQDNAGHLLRTDTTTFQAMPAVPSVIFANTTNFAMLPTGSISTWPDGKFFQKTLTYDAGFQTSSTSDGSTVSVPYGNQVLESDYDYGSGTTLGTLLRTVSKTYWAFQFPAALTQNILSPLSGLTTTDALTGKMETTTYGYDETALSAGNASIGWNANPVNGNTRGNQTSVHRALGSGTLTTTVAYANTGEIASITQPSNPAISVAETTSYGFSSAYQGGLLTSITPPLWKGPTYSYYPTNLLPLSATGPNSDVTTYSYDDADRLEDVIGPADPSGNQPESVTNYLSVNEIESRVKQNGTSWTISQVLYDGVGRPTTTQHPDGCLSGANLSTMVGYDANGRANSKSNPYCSPSDPTYGSVVTTFDALDRPVTETEQDNTSQRSWAYSDNTTTEYDELHNAWARTTDGLGRLIQVVEPGILTTTYTYDGFDNLTGVTQSGKSGDTPRTRRFSYDSLNRLLASSNPEIGTGVTCPGLSGTWSECYSYDPDGNVQTKTDATGRVTTFAYDAMNRVLSKRYSSDPSSTPTSCYQYDGNGVTNGVGLLAAEWTQSATSGACAATAPSTGFYTETSISAYDAEGRIVSETQCTSPGKCSANSPYPLQYVYDLAGNLTSIGNGLPPANVDSMSFALSYDPLNRLSSVLTQFNSASAPANLTSSASVLFQLPPAGGYGPLGLVAAQFAVNPSTGLVGFNESKSYDVRARSTGAAYVTDKSAGAATTSAGSIAVSGEETSTVSGYASASITITGSEASITTCTHPTEHGAPLPPVCTTIYDKGNLTVTVQAGGSVGNFSVAAAYGQGTTITGMLNEFLQGFNVPGSPVSAVINGNTLMLTSLVAGVNGQYQVTIANGQGFLASESGSPLTTNLDLTGGTNQTVYDAGSVSVTINNVTASTTWGQNDTNLTVASSLYNAIKTSMAGIVTPTLNGTVVNLQSASTGAATDFPITVNVTDNTLGIDAPSFSFAAQGMTDGMSTGEQTGTPIYSYTIPTGGYDADSNILAYTDSVNGSWSGLKYDVLNRLTGAAVTPVTGAAQYFCWYYDSFGNRRTQSTATAAFPSDPTGTCTDSAASASPITYNASNQITSTVQVPVVPTGAYDAAGKLVQDVEIVPGNRAVNQYLYDAAGNVCAMSASPLSGGTVMTGYLYNADGQRTAKGTIKTLSCDPVVSGFVETNGYVLGGGGKQLSEMKNGVWSHTNVYAGGQMLATYDTLGLHFQMTDWLGSRRAQTNPLGQIEETCVSLPFGDGEQCTIPTGAPATANDATEHHFTGKERDAESGLDYFGARYYASNMGRWMSPDWADKPEAVPYSSLDDPQTLNLYQYVRNNPLSTPDIDGHGWWSDFGNGLANATYRPLGQAIAHPITTAEGLGHAIAHPIATAEAIGSGIKSTSVGVMQGDGTAIGTAVGTVGMALIPGVGEVGDGAEATVGISDAALAGRAAEIHGALDPIAQSMRTTAAASVTDSNGVTSVMVGSSQNTLSPAQRALLGPGETAVTGAGHAETTVINAAQAQGMQVNAVAASRTICATCQQAIKDAGARAVNPPQ